VWSSCSPDFGVQGVLDRVGQIEPKVLVACDGYHYNGKAIDISDKLAEIAARAGEDCTDSRNAAQQVRQDFRARRRARPRYQEQGGAGESRGCRYPSQYR
jgi:acyl-coenzyme A synthetase/AMP-(fatty) acid ligase